MLKDQVVKLKQQLIVNEAQRKNLSKNRVRIEANSNVHELISKLKSSKCGSTSILLDQNQWFCLGF